MCNPMHNNFSTIFYKQKCKYELWHDWHKLAYKSCYRIKSFKSTNATCSSMRYSFAFNSAKLANGNKHAKHCMSSIAIYDILYSSRLHSNKLIICFNIPLCSFPMVAFFELAACTMECLPRKWTVYWARKIS